MADFTSNWPFFRENYCCTYDFFSSAVRHVAGSWNSWGGHRCARPPQEFHEPAINQQISQIQPNSVALMSW